MKSVGILVLVLLFGQGCASLTPEASAVRVTQNPAATAGCKFLGNVDVTNTWGPSDSEKKLQIAAAKLGANVLFIGPRMFTKLVTAHGEAYKGAE